MKFFSRLVLLISLLVSLLVSCNKISKQFPECAGITGDFNPGLYFNNTVEPYTVILNGKDTLNVQMIFTNYSPGSLLTSESFHLWLKSESETGDNIYFFDGSCSRGSDKWYGSSALYWHRRYTNCDFIFDKFTCNQVSGSSTHYVTQITDTSQIPNPTIIPDTLYYNFVGSK